MVPGRHEEKDKCKVFMKPLDFELSPGVTIRITERLPARDTILTAIVSRTEEMPGEYQM
jgi:hypothetical protein